MRINKKIALAAVMIFGASSLFAVSLEQVCAGLAAHPNTTGTFTQAKTMQTAKGSKTLKSSGTFIISQEGIMWKTEKPFPSCMAITETKIIQTAADGSQSVIDGSDNQTFASIASTLAAVFSSDLSQLQKNFSVDFADGGDGNWTLVLNPKDSTIASVLTQLDLSGTASGAGNDAVLLSIKMTESSGNTITYTFANQNYPQELTADEKANFKVK